MAKVLIIDYEKCNGCNECEKACSLHHYKVDDPEQSRIRVIKRVTDRELFIPVVCQQCKDAPCMEACPVNALTRDSELNFVRVDHDKCIGCKTCVTICPFGGVSFNTSSQKIMKCDFCHGEPECVKVCEPKAIQYTDVTDQSISKRVAVAEKYFSFYNSKIVEAESSENE